MLFAPSCCEWDLVLVGVMAAQDQVDVAVQAISGMHGHHSVG